MTPSGQRPNFLVHLFASGSIKRASTHRRRRLRWWAWTALRAFGVLLVVVLVAGWWFILRIVEHPSWPPPADAVTPAQAQAATEAFVARATPARR